MDDRRAYLKLRVENDQDEEVRKASFKHSLAHMAGHGAGDAGDARPLPPGKTFHQALYESDVRWRQARARTLDAQARERALLKAADETSNCTFSPTLLTSADMQLAAGARRQRSPASLRCTLSDPLSNPYLGLI